MEDIYVVGVGMTPFGRLLDKDIKTITKEAVSGALADAGIEATALAAAYFANASQGHMEKQHMVRGQVALRSMGIGQIPVVNVENACASGSSALNLAANFLKAGEGDIALAVGAEKMFSKDRELMLSAFDGAWDVSHKDEIRERLMKLGAVFSAMSGSGSTVFGIFRAAGAAEQARRALRKGGANAVVARMLSRA